MSCVIKNFLVWMVKNWMVKEIRKSTEWNQTPGGLISKFLLRDRCPIHYWIGGKEKSEKLIAFSHGATMDHRMFNAQVEFFLPDYRILVWDARGHGKSKPLQKNFILEDCAEDLAAILDEEKIKETILVGQSMGGYISQYFYLHYPERVRAMVIIGSTSIALPYPRWQIIALKATLPLFGIWPYEHFAKIVSRSTALKPDAQDYALKTIRSFDRKSFLTIWKAVTLAINKKGIPGHHINVPFLLTHGDSDDTGVIRKQAPLWAVSESEVQYVIIPNASHNANQDNPKFFNQTLADFLAGINA